MSSPTTARGWAWVEHILAGGTTPWAEFDGTPSGVPAGFFPGAAQLELARRVNLAGGRGEVVRRILATGAPARGRQEFLVSGVAETRGYGPMPIDPAEVPDAELIRVGVGVLTEHLAAAVPPVQPAATRGRLSRFRGNGVLTLPLAPVDRLLHDAWVTRARRGPVLPWQRWTVRLARADRVPPSMLFVSRGEHWLATGFRRRVELSPAALPPPIDAGAADLVRRIQPLLGGLLDREQRDRLAVQVLAPWLERRTGVRRLTLPVEARAWAVGLAERMAADVRRAGYPVRGDLTVLTEIDTGGPERPPLDDVLAVTVQVLCEGWEKR